MYRYILANTETYSPVMQSDELDDIIKKLKYVIDPKYYGFGHKELTASGLVKGCVENSGFFLTDVYIIIDTHSKDDNSNMEIYITSDAKMPYEELLSNIQQSIRNIKISQVLE